MALLKKSYNNENTVCTEIRSVEFTNVSKTHHILKSTDADIDGINFVDEDGDNIAGVWDVDGVKHAMILTTATTLEQVKESNTSKIKQDTDNKIRGIDIRSTDQEDQKLAFIAAETVLLEANEACATIQEAERILTLQGMVA